MGRPERTRRWTRHANRDGTGCRHHDRRLPAGRRSCRQTARQRSPYAPTGAAHGQAAAHVPANLRVFPEVPAGIPGIHGAALPLAARPAPQGNHRIATRRTGEYHPRAASFNRVGRNLTASNTRSFYRVHHFPLLLTRADRQGNCPGPLRNDVDRGFAPMSWRPHWTLSLSRAPQGHKPPRTPSSLQRPQAPARTSGAPASRPTVAPGRRSGTCR